MTEARTAAPLRLAVVGGGIAGLTLAAACASMGLTCNVFEQAARLAEVGAGVQLAPNAVRPLRRLGCGPALDRHAVRIEAMEIRGWTGRLIARTPLGAECERLFGAPYYTVHRAHLHEALRALAGPGRLRLGARLSRIREDRDGVRLAFADGSRHRAEVVAGADGIHSVVLEAIRRDQPAFSGFGMLRGLVPTGRLPAAARDPLVRLWLGPGGHFVCYPVSAGRQVSFAATVPFGDAAGESWSAPGDPAELRGCFAGWRGLISDLISAAGPVRRWALHDREPLPAWSTGRITLVGDAAHPMLPFMAQGANQAVEDAVDLAACLRDAAADSIAAALARYQARRIARTSAVQQGSRGNARVMHLGDGTEQRERDEAMGRSAGLRGREWLYGYQAGSP